jgi:hypothetical protein
MSQVTIRVSLSAIWQATLADRTADLCAGIWPHRLGDRG